MVFLHYYNITYFIIILLYYNIVIVFFLFTKVSSPDLQVLVRLPPNWFVRYAFYFGIRYPSL